MIRKVPISIFISRKLTTDFASFFSFQSSDGRSAGVSGLVGKVRGLRDDVQRKISRLKNDGVDQQRANEQGFHFSASSVESLPSGSGSSM